MKRWLFAGTGIAILTVAALGQRHVQRTRAAEERAAAQGRALERRDAFAAEALALAASTSRQEEGPFAALAALAIDHELGLEPGVEERLALDTAAFAARRFAEHVVVRSDDPFRAAAFDPDGDRLALVGDEPVLRVVDAKDGKVLAQKPLPSGGLAVRWTPEGKELVVVGTTFVEVRSGDGETVRSQRTLATDRATLSNDASLLAYRRDGTMTLEEAATGAGARKLSSGQRFVRFAADDKSLVLADDNGALGLLDRAPWKERAGPFPYGAEVHDAMYALDGRVLHLATSSGVQSWQLDVMSQGGNGLPSSANESMRIALSRSGTAFAEARADGAIGHHSIGAEPGTNHHLTDHEGHRQAINALVFSPDGARLASASSDGTAILWRDHAAHDFVTLDDGQGHQSLRWTADGGVLLVSTYAIEVHDRSGKPPRELRPTPSIELTAGATFGEIGIAKGRRGQIFFWNTTTMQERERITVLAEDEAEVTLATHAARALACHAGRCSAVDELGARMGVGPAGVVASALAPDGEHAAFTTGDGYWSVRRTKDGAAIGTVAAPGKAANFTGDGSTLLVIDAGASTLHDVKTGALRARLSGEYSELDDGGTRVRMTEGDTVHFYDASTGAALGSFVGAGRRHALAPDGKLDAVATADEHEVEVMDTATGKPALTLHLEAAKTTFLTWSPDGAWIGTASDDKVLRVWDVTKGGALVLTRPAAGPPQALLLSRDHRRLLETTERYAVRSWDISPESALTTACAVAKKRPDFGRVAAVCR